MQFEAPQLLDERARLDAEFALTCSQCTTVCQQADLRSALQARRLPA
jgi:hypothetical protein